MKRSGKIAHLSWELQHQLNSYLDNGESGKALVQWLNSLPEMQHVVRHFFAGKPVTKQNLSEWTKGGFQEWRVRLGKVDGALNLAREAADLESFTDGRLADRLATALTGRYANLVHGWDGEVTEEFSKKLRVLQRMVQDSANLRRWDHDAVRVRLAEAAHEAVQEQTNEALFEQFEEWARKPKVRDYLLMKQQTHREQEQRERARWELLKTPVKPPEEPPPVSPMSDPAYNPHPNPVPPAAPVPASNPVQVSPGQSNLSAGAGTASPHNATPADAPSNHQSAPQTPDARPQTPPPESNPVKPSQGQSNLSGGVGTACPHNPTTPDHQPSSDRQSVLLSSIPVNGGDSKSNPVKLSQGQSNLSAGLATVCRHNSATPDAPSDCQSVSLSSISVNGGEGRGEEAFYKNVPSPSQASTASAPSVQNPAPSPEPKAPSLPLSVPSPCIGVCKFNDGGFCKSCFRNTIEKVRWPTMAEVEKAFVVATCAKRKANQHPSRLATRQNP